MTSTIKFIDTIIRNIQPQNKRQTFWCYGCPDFGIRINPNSSKIFIFKYMSGEKKDKSRWISIGKYPEWTIRKARQEYDKLYEQVHNYGRDPVAEKKAEAKKQKESYTVAAFIMD